jgi:hypothetical protein
MALRRIAVATNVNYTRTAKIYRDAVWEEYVVKFSIDGKKQVNADYHTDDKEDALDTASTYANLRGSRAIRQSHPLNVSTQGAVTVRPRVQRCTVNQEPHHG